jgi:DNA-binding CsgD family transcriptional regulator/KaiC/GvpD/RAD55 family RecA-like ATPase
VAFFRITVETHGVEERPNLIGRADVRRRVREQLADGSVLVYGPPGIGKSTLVGAVAADLAGSGNRVMWTSPGPSEATLPYLALIDLFGPTLSEVRGQLPTHLLTALEVALMRRDAGESPHDQLAVRLAVLELLRVLAADRPIIVVLDDVQWVDPPSAEVLSFAARRLPGDRVRVLAAERVEDGAEPTQQALCPQPLHELMLEALPEPDLAELLRTRLGAGYPRGMLHRVYQASAGNPFYALELARALSRRGRPLGVADPLPVSDRLRGLLAERLATLDNPVRRGLLLVAASARPTRTLLADCGVSGELEAARVAGLVDVRGNDLVTFTHPLLGELIYGDASEVERIAAHRTLSHHIDEPIERGRHLALATPAVDESLAQTLMAAAEAAAGRGAPAIAAALTRLAAERTPPGEPERVAARLLSAARLARTAGLPVDAREAAETALSVGTSRQTRVFARLLLVELEGQDLSRIDPLLDAAYTDARGVPRLEARVRLQRAAKAEYDGDYPLALAEASEAERLADASGDTECLVEALTFRGGVEGNMGDPRADELHRRSWELARDLPLTAPVVHARQLWAMTLVFRGDVEGGLREIVPLRAAVERGGTLRELAWVLISYASIHMRAGRASGALVAGRRCAQLFEDVELTPGIGLVVGSGVELLGGTVEAGARYAERAVAACENAGDEEWLHVALAQMGQAHLLAGDPAAAVDVMRRARAIEERLGLTDPAIVPWHADFGEALVGAGFRHEAADLVADVRAKAERMDRQVVMLGLARVESLINAASGDSRSAADELRRTLDKYADHPYPLDVARGYLTLGVLERRAHRRSAAREALVEAENRYTVAGAVPWVAVVRTELARLDGGRAGGELSDTEQRIVELVRAGATNREIAGTLFLSVKAVEANLTRLYRRLGVRNRTQLVRALDGAQPGGSEL